MKLWYIVTVAAVLMSGAFAYDFYSKPEAFHIDATPILGGPKDVEKPETLLDKWDKATTTKGKDLLVQDEIISKVKAHTYTKNAIDIEIESIDRYGDGAYVFIRAWKDGEQIGFGDGSIDLERIKMGRVSMFVEAATGTIERTHTNPEGGLITTKYKIDAKQWMQNDLAHTVKVLIDMGHAKVGSQIIEAGKRGNTVSTINPNAHEESSSVDGWCRKNDSNNWNTTHDAADAGDCIDSNTDDIIAETAIQSNSKYRLRRGFMVFDVDADIPDTDVISAAVASYYVTATNNGDNDGDDYVSITVAPTIAADTSLAVGDFNECTLTEAHATGQRKDLSDVATSEYLDWTLDATGIAEIDPAEKARFCSI